MRPRRPLFHASPAARKGPISSKRVSSQDPLLRKFGNFSLYSLIFHPNFSSQAPKFGIFSSQAPKFGNFPLTSPQIWKFSAHKPPFSEANASSQAPHFGNPGCTPLPEKKLSAPPPEFNGGISYGWQSCHQVRSVSYCTFRFLWQSTPSHFFQHVSRDLSQVDLNAFRLSCGKHLRILHRVITPNSEVQQLTLHA